MFLGMTINVNDLPQDEQQGGVIPAGQYIVKIERAQLKDTKSGTGRYISLMLRVQGPTHSNAVVFAMVNISNQNQEAERIGKAQLRSIMESIGLQTITDTDQLVGGVMDVKIAVEKDTYNGNEQDRNVVKSFKKSQSGAALVAGMPQSVPAPFAPQPPVMQPQPQQPVAAANQSAPVRPW